MPRVYGNARVVDVAVVVDRLDVLGRIQAFDRPPGDRGEARRALGRLRKRRLERFVLPAFFAPFRDRFHTTSIIPVEDPAIGKRRRRLVHHVALQQP